MELSPLRYPAQTFPPSTYSTAAAAVSWAIILFCIVTIGFINWSNGRSPARTNAIDDIQVRITSKIIVGEFAAMGSSQMKAAAAERVIAPLAKRATPVERFCLAAVLGHIKGGEQALAEINRIKAPADDTHLQQDLAAMRQIYTTGPASLSPAQRQGLIDRHGWFGKLALSFGLPNSDPLRREVLHGAQMTFLTTTLLELAAFLAALVGVVLLIVLIVRLSTGRLHRCYRPATFHSSAFIESFALYLGGYFGIGLLAKHFAPHWAFLGVILSIGWIPLAMLWPLARGVHWNELRGGLGWYLGAGFFREAAAGITGYITGLPLLIAAGFITMLLSRWSGANAAHPIVLSSTKSLWNVLTLYLIACVFAPLVEETMFRGALFNHLRQWHGWLISAAGSALIFASLHPQGWTAIPVLGCIGFTLAAIREWRGTFVASATAHALNNAVVMTLLVVALR